MPSDGDAASVWIVPARGRVVEHPRCEGIAIAAMVVALQVSRAVSVAVRHRRADGAFVESTLDRVSVDEVVDGLPVREFRWYKGRQCYSGWYWSATSGRLVAYESRLERARIVLADFAPDVVAVAAQPFQLATTSPRT